MHAIHECSRVKCTGLRWLSGWWCQQWLVSNSDTVIKSVKISPGMGMYAGLHCSLCYPNKNLNYTRNFLIVDHFKVINSFVKALLYPCMYYGIDLHIKGFRVEIFWFVKEISLQSMTPPLHSTQLSIHVCFLFGCIIHQMSNL